MTPSAEQQSIDAARDFRAQHSLGTQPLGDLVALIEQTTGYDVAVLDAEPNEHGMTMRDPDRDAVFIGVARTGHPMRQRSTLAHELAHVLFEDWGANENLSTRAPEEVRADAFARHLLAPQAGVIEFLGKRESVNEADLSAVVQWFLVSPAIAAIQMRDAGYLNAERAQEWMGLHTPELATRHGWRDRYAALQSHSDTARAPQSLVARAVTGYAEGVVSAQVVATLRGVSVEVVLDEFAAAGISPPDLAPQSIAVEELPDVHVDLSDLEDEDAPQ